MGNLGWQEIMLIMVLALVVFGPKRLPEIGRQIGKAIREVRKVSGQFQEEIRSGLALDDENFPYMPGPRREVTEGTTPAAPVEAPAEPGGEGEPQPDEVEAPAGPRAAEAPDPAATASSSPATAARAEVRYGEVRPPDADQSSG